MAVGVVPLVQRGGLSRNEDGAGTEQVEFRRAQNRTRANKVTKP